MYYAHPCSYCSKIFYTYNSDKFAAAKCLYAAIKKHLIEYDEDHKEYDFDDGPTIDTNEVYAKMKASNDPFPGGYEVE